MLVVGLSRRLILPIWAATAPNAATSSPPVAPVRTTNAPASTVSASPATPESSAQAEMPSSPAEFASLVWPHAERAAARIGVAPEVLVAQSALETGWGRHVMQHRDGVSSHNLFGIKADRRWQGDKVHVSTLEYRDGVALNTRANFRAYQSFEKSFDDYVDFLQRNPRYREALQTTADPAAYFDALQRAGYATDPAYADKIKRILDSEPVRQIRRTVKEGAALI